MKINETIRNLRKGKGLRQTDFANKMNCNRQKIADWERGKSTPSAKDLILLAQKFNVSTDYLLGLTNAETTDKDIRFICDYTGLDEDTINCIAEITKHHILKRLLENVVYDYAPLVRLVEEEIKVEIKQ